MILNKACFLSPSHAPFVYLSRYIYILYISHQHKPHVNIFSRFVLSEGPEKTFSPARMRSGRSLYLNQHRYSVTDSLHHR
jgi:hypothetical protein